MRIGISDFLLYSRNSKTSAVEKNDLTQSSSQIRHLRDSYEKNNDNFMFSFNDYLKKSYLLAENTGSNNPQTETIYDKETGITFTVKKYTGGSEMSIEGGIAALKKHFGNDTEAIFRKLGELSGDKKMIDGVEIIYIRSLDPAYPSTVAVKYPNGESRIVNTFLSAKAFFEEVDKFFKNNDARSNDAWSAFFNFLVKG